MTPTGLKVDHREQFLGLGNPHPRLSWHIESTARNVRQAACRIRVASSQEALRAGRADLWDSGRVHSRRSFDIEYAGRPLTSRARCWWSVEIWDESGETGRSGGNDWWEMGLLNPTDWSAQWLAVEDRIARADRIAGLHWIWADGAPSDLPTHRFRLAFELCEAAASGEVIVAVKQSFFWSQITRIWLDGVPLAGPGRWIERPPAAFDAPTGTTICNLTSQRVAVNALARGRHVLAVEVGTRPISSWLFASPETPPNVPGMASLCRLELASGETLRLITAPEWKANSDASIEGWHRPDFDDTEWAKAKANPAESHQPWPAQPAMHLRQTFFVAKKVTTARLYVTALGAYEARLNGAKVGDALLAPGPAQYDKHVLYQIFDVGPLVQAGENAIGLTVADGWYASYEGRFAWADPLRRVIAQLELTYADGSRDIITTRPGWRIAESAVRSSQIKIGEVHDYRMEPTGWDRVGFDDSDWEEAGIAEPPACRLEAQYTPPIRVKRRIKPHTITKTAQGHYVIDFGICFGGWCELHVIGAEGTRIEVGYSEILGPAGEIDQTRMTYDPYGEPRRDVFCLRGDPKGERLASCFVYRGFRFVQIAGLASSLQADDVEGVFVHSDLEETARIDSDHSAIEETFSLVMQSQRSNFVGVPVDNNTREVRGYLGEMAIFGDAASHLMDVSTFFPYHINVTADEQNEDGTFPLYSPCPRHANVFPQPPGDAPGCGSSVVVLVWQCWRQYGDTALIVRNWGAMERNLLLILDHNPNYLWLHKRGLDFGDWLSLEPTPKDLMATAFWAYSVALLAELADAIGRPDDATRLIELHVRIQAAFNAAFVGPDGTIGNGSQTGYVLPLAFDLLPAELRGKTADRLANAIRTRSPWGLTTGTCGTRFLLDVLADNGHPDLAYDLLTSTDFPSWGYMLRNGAKAMWESWDGEMYSHNQPALGSVGGFLVRRIAGIEAAAPGFTKITIRPLADPRLKSGGGEYRSIMGRIATQWRRSENGAFHLDVLIPANAQAQAHLPTGDPKSIHESGQSIAARKDVRIVASNESETVIAMGSGRYRFSTPT